MTATGTRPRTAPRALALARFNWTLMVRNRTTMLYAFAVPLLPLALLFTADASGADPGAVGDAGVAVVGAALVTALLFPGYYNLLSMFVTRRDELVLKRLRTGEIRDAELIVSMALPGAAITLAVAVATIPVAGVAGFPLPGNPLLLATGILLGVAAFAALAVWTAAWTRTAEAAQLTSAPVMVIAIAGFVAPALPDRWQSWFDLLPGAAVGDLVRTGWFGQSESGAAVGGLSFLEAWVAAAPALGVLAGWLLLAAWLAGRSLRWEPRA
ncbi:ABC transporter permease [Nocardioides ferulae]|uniref:ABC transporter permease n=1 Tax=Nocardioides ferulae TaxID=2340821 RepID=UPI000EB46D58|nr:ABC transporter permease [Nocardioides ferulae]